MMVDNKMNDLNVEYYNKNAESFFESTVNTDMSEWQNRFLQRIPAGGRILDAGCGSGRDSKAFIKQGYSVVAFDASREMCKKASDLLGQEVWQMRFEEMSFEDEFDGVWACASLLHVGDKDLPNILKKIHNSLKEEGILYASFKYGDGEKERGERNFIDFTEESIKPILIMSGFEIVDSGITSDIRPGRENEKWTNVIAGKKLDYE